MADQNVTAGECRQVSVSRAVTITGASAYGHSEVECVVLKEQNGALVPVELPVTVEAGTTLYIGIPAGQPVLPATTLPPRSWRG